MPVRTFGAPWNIGSVILVGNSLWVWGLFREKQVSVPSPKRIPLDITNEHTFLITCQEQGLAIMSRELDRVSLRHSGGGWKSQSTSRGGLKPRYFFSKQKDPSKIEIYQKDAAQNPYEWLMKRRPLGLTHYTYINECKFNFEGRLPISNSKDEAHHKESTF